MLAAITVPSLTDLLLAGVVLFSAWRLSKHGGGAALTEYDTANKRLERSLAEARTETARLIVELAKLQGETNVALAVAPVLEWSRMHEQRAAERHSATITVLDLIAARLGPEPNGVS